MTYTVIATVTEVRRGWTSKRQLPVFTLVYEDAANVEDAAGRIIRLLELVNLDASISIGVVDEAGNYASRVTED